MEAACLSTVPSRSSAPPDCSSIAPKSLPPDSKHPKNTHTDYPVRALLLLLQRATQAEAETPKRLQDDTLAFMFETWLAPRLTPQALSAPNIDRNYYRCWVGLKNNFDPAWRPAAVEEMNWHGANGQKTDGV
jgi:hypothetical protein